MKALLIGINSKYIHPALALYQLKANTTYDCDILEFTIKDDINHVLQVINSYLLTAKYSLIGFSTYLWNIQKALFLSRVIKELFPIHIVFGGPESANDAQYFLTNFPSIDYIIKGEGENSFHELMEHLHQKRSISEVSNLAYFDGKKYIENPIKICDLSKIKLATLMTKDLENQVVYVESSRGCPFKCSYCTASLDNKVRFFPLDEILQILSVLMKKKAKTVKFLDRTFNAKKSFMLSILKHIEENNICTTFQFEIVADRLDNDIITYIKGLNKKYLRFEVGIQTTNNSVNKRVNRTQSMDKLKENIYLLNETGNVDIHADLIAGLPGETIDSFIDSFNEAFLLKCTELQLGFLKFLRGTKLLEDINKYGYLYNSAPPYEIIKSNSMSEDDLIEIKHVEKALNYYYNSKRFIHTFQYLFNNNIINNYYLFFKELEHGISNKQLYILFKHLDDYFKLNYLDYYDDLHYNILVDYLMQHKVKPKKWWNDCLTKEQRKLYYQKITALIPKISMEDLYEYSITIESKTKLCVVIYKNFIPIHYEISKELII